MEMDMESREYPMEHVAAPARSLDNACDERLDRALEDTFPASDPIATNLYD
jgi:hypothetical protein